MSTPVRAEPNPLARIRLELSAGRGRGWIAWCALVAAALVIGAAADRLCWSGQVAAAVPGEASALRQLPALRQSLEQAHLQLRVAEARGHELERQIDTLNQRLRECQEELGFFRKARDGKR